ncbi:MAG: type IV pilus secretin PilQ [Geobacter sp.]|nr:type IV pilus secretin PilQ [Geobacter sp.]
MLIVTLGAAAGCAHRPLDESRLDARGSLGSLQDIRTASNEEYDRVEITADRALTYTFYKLPDPPVAVLDISDVTPGSVVSSIDVNSGNLGKIAVNRHDLAGGVLTRVEIGLKRDLDVSVTVDPENKAKLFVTLQAPTTQEAKTPAPTIPVEPAVVQKAEESPSAVKQEAAPSASQLQSEPAKETVETKPEPPMAKENESRQTEAPAASAAEPKEFVQVAQLETNQPAATEKGETKGAASDQPQVKVLTSLKTVQDGVEIAVTGPVENYKVFTLKEPARLVIDLFGVKSGVVGRKIGVDAFGVASARIGEYQDKTRIVFDAAQTLLPAYEVVRTDAGIKLAMTPPSAEAVQKAAKPVAPVAEEKALVQPVRAKAGVVESLDFKSQDDMSRIVVKVTGDCRTDEPAKIPGGIAFTVRNCALPKKLQRSLDTSAFAGSVLRVTPYQVRTKKGADTKVVVKLRQDTEYSLSREGDAIVLALKNPPREETPALISEAVKPAEAAPVTKAAVAQGTAKNMNAVEEKAGQDSPARAKSGEKKTYTGRRVTLEFVDADIRKIFQLLAEVSNLNFLIGDDVSGTISIKLVNVPWDQALDVILEAKNLGMQREGNIVQIRPKDKIKSLAEEEVAAKKAREQAMELRTEIFEVNFASIGDVASQFNSLKSERGTITQDARTNKVIVKDVPTAIEDMKFLLKTLDVPEKQVMIEARIVEATSTFTRDLGVQWGIHYKDGSAQFFGINSLDAGLGGVVSSAPTSGTSGPGAAVGMSFGKLTSNVQLDLKLSAAATAGLIKIISTPKVATLNNKAAKISQGQSIPYQTTSAEGTKTEFVEAALTLEVTPHISSDGSIIMKIKASNNSPGTGSPPPINKKETTTELLVKSGETTVIGGIYVDSDTENDTGVPFLQNIPLLGWLFKSNTKTKTKTELLIFITPRLMI